MKTVLIIDSDLGFVFWLGKLLGDAGYQALPAKGVSEARALLGELNTEIDLLIVNPSLPGAPDFVSALRRSYPNSKVLTALGEKDQSADRVQISDVTARKPLVQDPGASTLWLRMVGHVLSIPGNSSDEIVG
jgi:DNA-binding response OmpR family regulator